MYTHICSLILVIFPYLLVNSPMFSHGSQNFARLGAGRAGQRPAAAQMAALSSRGWTQLGVDRDMGINQEILANSIGYWFD